jgi:type VII secretion protein EccE
MATTREAPPRSGAAPGASASSREQMPAPRLTLQRRPGHIGAVSVAQLVLLELALVAGLVMLRHRTPFLVAGIVLGVLILVLTFGRRRGRWWAEYVVLRRQYRRRRRSAHPPATDRRLTQLHDLAPDLTVQTVEGADDVRVGVGADGAGWFAIVAVVASDGVRGGVGAVPLGVLAKAAKDAEQPGATVQVVTHTMPAPATRGDGPPCDESYGELLAPVGGVAPADQITWVAVRLDARTMAAATLTATTQLGPNVDREATARLATLARRVAKALRRARCTVQILDADGLLDALARSVDLERTEGRSRDGQREDWSTWRSDTLVHACFWLRTWPQPDDAGPLLDQLALTSPAFTSVAVSVRPAGRAAADASTEIRGLIRVAAAPEALAASCAGLTEVARGGGARLFRLDGEQAPAVYASAPTGGGAS